MRRIGVAPAWVRGSAHAITVGLILIASANGSQLPTSAYAMEKVIWIAGAQKLVKNLCNGTKRHYEYRSPLMDRRACKAYDVAKRS